MFVNFNSFRIEICGGIAAGKTTLSLLLKSLGLHIINENFASNPFLHKFYINPTYFSFETELTFLLQHYHDIKIAKKNKNYIVCDYSFYLDLAYSDITLNTNAQKIIFSKVMEEVFRQISPPDFVIYLECPTGVLLNRIQKRGRDFEKTITIEYLSVLSEAIEKRMREYKSNSIISLDSNKINFADNIDHQKIVLDLIKSKVFKF